MPTIPIRVRNDPALGPAQSDAGDGTSYRSPTIIGKLRPHHKKLCLEPPQQNTAGKIYYVCPMSEEEIEKYEKNERLRRNPPQLTNEQFERSLPPDRPEPTASGDRMGSAGGDAFDKTTAAHREANPLGEVLCGGLGAGLSIEGQKVIGKRAGGRECESPDLLAGKGGDATYGKGLKKEFKVFGITISLWGSGEIGADPNKAVDRVATEVAQPVGDLGKALSNAGVNRLERALDAANNPVKK